MNKKSAFLVVSSLLLAPFAFRPFLKAQTIAGVGVPDDWSHHSLVFSTPSTAEQSFRVGGDPRYLHSRIGRYIAGKNSRAGAASVDLSNPPELFPWPATPTPVSDNRGLWGQSLSAGGSTWASPGPQNFPAKFGFYDTTTINCGNTATPDYVAYGLQSGTVSSQTGTFTGTPTSGQTVTLGGSVVLTASVSTSATGTVTIANEPSYLDTVKIGSVTYIWQPATSVTATGTVTLATAPAYQDTVQIGAKTYIWQEATAIPATGTVTLANAPAYQDTVKIGATTYIWQPATSTSSTGTVTLANAPAYQDTVKVGATTYIWQPATSTSSTGTVTLTNEPAAGDKVTVGATTYIWQTSCTGVSLCVVRNANTTTDATNLKNAIGGTCGGTACAANTSATATTSTHVVTLTARTAGTAGNFSVSLPVNTAANTAAGGSNAENGCTGVSDCVALTTNTTTDATNLKNAIGGACGGTTCAANTSVTASTSTNVVTLTARTAGTAGNFSVSLPVNVAANTAAGGSNAENGCTGVNDCVALTTTVNTNATNLKNAVGGTCAGNTCAANASVTATSSGHVVTLTAKTAGTSGDFALTLPVNGGANTVAGGTGGENGCTGVNDCVALTTNVNTNATNLANAVGGTCGGNTCAANASVTATSDKHTLTLTAKTAGAAGNFTLTLPVNVAANTVAGGNGGENGCTGVNDCIALNTAVNTEATNLKNAVSGTCAGNTCAANPSVTATSSGHVVTLTAGTAGTAGNFTLSLPVNVAANTVTGGNTGTDGANTETSFQTGVSTTADATNLAAAVNRNGPAVGVAATSSGATVTVKSTVAGSITLAKTLTNFTWASGTIAGTMTGGSSTQATIVAYDNLYTSCTGTVPSVYWSYNTSTSTATSAQVIGSPVLSLDGTEVAFVERSSSTAYLVLLRWKSGQGTSAAAPVTPTTQSTTGANYVTCKAGTGSCQLTLSLSNNDTNSSPFVDYTHDILYVGDSSGKLHQVTGVFKGTPTLDTTNAGWPVNVNNGTVLTSPVYDYGSSLVFVGDSTGKLSSVTSGAGPTVHTSSEIEFRTGGIAASPIVDSTTGSVYVFVSCDGACSAATNNAVFKFPTSFTNGSGAKQILGATGTTITNQIVPTGTFDNIYYSGSGNTGNLYTCGYTTGLAPALYKIPMSGTWGSASVTSTGLAGGAGACSPVTENLSGVANTDWLFLSVSANGNLAGCTGDCIYSFNAYSGSPVFSAGRQATAGASGIVIDNSASAAGASQIYYASQGVATTAAGYSCPSPSGGSGSAATAGGCAVQASQAALQ